LVSCRISVASNASMEKGVLKSNPNYNLKSTLTTTRALTYNTCYAHAIKKENRVLNS
jgi:hypothetical protein